MTSSTPMATPPGRNASLDALRVLSLLGIVTLHVANGGFHDAKPLGFVLDELSRFAVPVFFILSAYFWKAEELERPLQLIGRVTARVGLPFIAWVLVTIAWNAVFRPSRELDLSPGGLVYILWTGEPAYHLWFLPALIVGTAIVSLAGRYAGWRVTLVLTLVLFMVGMLLGAYAPVTMQLVLPFWIFRNGILFAPVFLAAGVLLRRHRERVAELPMPAIAASVLIFAAGQVAEGYFIVPSYPMGHDFSISTLGYGISMMLMFMRLHLGGALWTTLGRATFTAYLVHILVIATLVDTFQLGANSLLVIALTFTISLAIGTAWQQAAGMLRRRTPLR